jgi:hypothetical protein
VRGLSFLPQRGGGAEPPGPREARPEDRLREAEGEVLHQHGRYPLYSPTMAKRSGRKPLKLVRTAQE